MRRVLAAIVAVSVCVLQAQALAFHVHRVSDHESSHHHTHGPAVHHHAGAFSDSEHRISSSADAGGTITLAVPSAESFGSAVVAVVESGPSPSDQPVVPFRSPLIESRSHGPPAMWRVPFRGPPFLLPM